MKTGLVLEGGGFRGIYTAGVTLSNYLQTTPLSFYTTPINIGIPTYTANTITQQDGDGFPVALHGAFFLESELFLKQRFAFLQKARKRGEEQ